MAKNTQYDHVKIEEHWHGVWEETRLFQDTLATADPNKESLYLLFAFAYPSGQGLHVGHVESKTALDILARFNRMHGKTVFFPVGWDAFGLPAENYAVKTGVHPAETTRNAIDTFRRQIKRVGISYDWKSEIATSHPGYYKWTQWLFLELYKKGLAYQGTGQVNWCPSCQTVLANEQVVEGKCERCDSEVIQKEMKQWYFKITDYKDELISGLDQVDWPKATKLQQLNWIGKREGVQITFSIENSDAQLECFTTRIDTIFGVTFIAVSPEKFAELDLLAQVGSTELPLVEKYIENSKKRTEEERMIGEKNKTGEDTGLFAINPVNQDKIRIFVADYVLAGYGTGAVMGVPCHDERDWLFAVKHNLPVKRVVAKKGLPARSYLMGGSKISDESLEKIGVKIVERMPSGDRKLEFPETKETWNAYEDLIISNLEYGFWNEQIGFESGFIIRQDPTNIYMSTLQEATKDFITEDINALLEANNDELRIKEDLWIFLAKNSWYTDYIRYSDYGVLINSGNFNGLTSEEAMDAIPKAFPELMQKTTTYKLRDWLISRQRYWGAPIPIVYDPDGKPHAVKEEHLPWTLPTDVDFKPTGESPLTSSKEFQERVEKLYGPGWRPEYDTMDTFVDSSWYYLRYVSARDESQFADPERLAKYLPVDFYMIGPEHIVLHLLYSRFFTKFLRDQGYLQFDEPFQAMRHQGMILGPDNKKMSKSKGNVINPDDIIQKFGADTLRMYEMFMGPIESDKPWDISAVAGVYRFLQRVLSLVEAVRLTGSETPDHPDYLAVRRKLHQTIEKVSKDIPARKYNTAIAALMECVNVWEKANKVKVVVLPESEVLAFIQIMAPFAPFMTEELYQRGREISEFSSVHQTEWPSFDPEMAAEDMIELPVQVDGKVRAKLQVAAADAAEETKVIAQAQANEAMIKWLDGKTIVKTIYIPGKILSFVTK